MCVGERTLLGDGEHLFSEESALSSAEKGDVLMPTMCALENAHFSGVEFEESAFSNAEKVCIRKRVCVGERTLLGDGEHLFSEESALSSARKDVLMPTNVR